MSVTSNRTEVAMLALMDNDMAHYKPAIIDFILKANIINMSDIEFQNWLENNIGHNGIAVNSMCSVCLAWKEENEIEKWQKPKKKLISKY